MRSKSALNCYPWYPSILHATRASLSSHSSSHTVPQPPPKFTSTLPFDGDDPPTKRMSTEKVFHYDKFILNRGGFFRNRSRRRSPWDWNRMIHDFKNYSKYVYHCIIDYCIFRIQREFLILRFNRFLSWSENTKMRMPNFYHYSFIYFTSVWNTLISYCMRLQRQICGYNMDLDLPDKENNQKVNFHLRCNVNH